MKDSMQWKDVIARARIHSPADANYLEAMRKGLEAQVKAARELNYRFYGVVTCTRCGSKNTNGNDIWRWAGDHWQHRCKDVHPQTGHWRVD